MHWGLMQVPRTWLARRALDRHAVVAVPAHTRENTATEQYQVQVHKEHAAREARHDLGNLLLKTALALFGRSVRQSALMCTR